MVQGFPNNGFLNQLRDNLRTNFKNSPLQQSIDSRYSIQTAHSTVMRFRDKIMDKENLFKTLEKYETFDFGKFKVDKIEFVQNDWYQRSHSIKHLCSFDLK